MSGDVSAESNIPHSTPLRRFSILGFGLILLSVLLVVWKSSLDGAFQFDDHDNIINREATLWPLTEYLVNNRPVGLYSLAISKHWSGNSTFGFHLFNLAVHATNALLLFAGILLSRRIWLSNRDIVSGLSFWWVSTAALVALTWAIHPLTTQAVTYIVQRYESLSAMGYLGAWVGILIFQLSTSRSTRFAGSVVVLCSAWIGLLSKEVFATAPLVILLYQRLISEMKFASLFRFSWYVYLLMLSPFIWFIPSVSRWFDVAGASGSSGVGGSMGFGMRELSSWEYLRTQPEIILHYLKLSIWPDPLCIDYLWRIQKNPAVFLSLGAVILTLISIGLWSYCRGTIRAGVSGQTLAQTRAQTTLGLIGWGVLAFFFILAPTCSIVPIVDMAVEHRMYLPLTLVVAGIVFSVGYVVRCLWSNSENKPVLAIGVGLFVIAILSSLGWRTHVRNLDYRDELTIWMGVTEVSPGNPRGWYHVGSLMYKRGNPDAALPYMVSAVGIGGTRTPLYDVGLGDCLRKAGRSDEALYFYRRAVENRPKFAQAHNNLGVLYLDQQNDDMARKHFELAAELELPEAMNNLATVLERQGNHELAVVWLQRAIEAAKRENANGLSELIRRRLRKRLGSDSDNNREGSVP